MFHYNNRKIVTKIVTFIDGEIEVTTPNHNDMIKNVARQPTDWERQNVLPLLARLQPEPPQTLLLDSLTHGEIEHILNAV